MRILFLTLSILFVPFMCLGAVSNTAVATFQDAPNPGTNLITEQADVATNSPQTNFSGTITFVPVAGSVNFRILGDTIIDNGSSNLVIGAVTNGSIQYAARTWNFTYTNSIPGSGAIVNVSYDVARSTFSDVDGATFRAQALATGPAAITNFAQFFATNTASAEMWVIDGAGTETQLSAHDKDGRHIAKSHNVYTGQGKVIDLWRLAEAVERLTGQTDIIQDYTVPRKKWDEAVPMPAWLREWEDRQ